MTKILVVDDDRDNRDYARKYLAAISTDDKEYAEAAGFNDALDLIKSRRFDLIIMDPPTFSNSKRMEDFLDIQRDHVELINDCMKILTHNGFLFFSTNFTKFQLEKDKVNASSITDITKATTPFDFEGKLRRWCFLIRK